MAMITNVRKRVHHAYELKTPGVLRLDEDRSIIVMQVAVPPQDFVEGDTLYVTAGEGEPDFRHPLRPLIDMYRSELVEAADTYLRIERIFVDLLSNLKLDPQQLVELHGLHQALRFGYCAPVSDTKVVHIVPQAHAAVGVLLARAIAVPPRQSLSVYCDKGSKVTVYLGGLVSRPA